MTVYKIALIIFLVTLKGVAQETKNILFLGNSYTAANNLAQTLEDVAASTGNTVIADTNTPGGYTLEGHTTNSVSLEKIKYGNWDFVVLQEQSQRPSLPIADVETLVYPFARKLNDSILTHNPCAETAFYMTWGRENGDAGNCKFWPPVCTYEGMDDLLRERYLFMATDNGAITAPVGAVWRYIRDHNLGINLYSNDGSHPSIAGTYVAALTFYTALFRNDPTLVTFNSSLSTADANSLKEAVKIVVFDNMSLWNIGAYDPIASFDYNHNGLTYSFTNTSTFANQFSWDFGDGTTSNEENPVHIYNQEGVCNVTLNAGFCDFYTETTQSIAVLLTVDDYSLKNTFTIYPNPVSDKLYIDSLLNLNESLDFEIYSVLGKKVNFDANSWENRAISLACLKEGLYFLVIYADNKVLQTFKFVKK